VLQWVINQAQVQLLVGECLKWPGFSPPHLYRINNIPTKGSVGGLQLEHCSASPLPYLVFLQCHIRALWHFGSLLGTGIFYAHLFRILRFSIILSCISCNSTSLLRIFAILYFYPAFQQLYNALFAFSTTLQLAFSTFRLFEHSFAPKTYSTSFISAILRYTTFPIPATLSALSVHSLDALPW